MNQFKIYAFLMLSIGMQTVESRSLQTTTTQGGRSGDKISINANKYGLELGSRADMKQFLTSDKISVTANIDREFSFANAGANAERDVPIYIVAVYNGIAYIKLNNNQWVPLGSNLIASETRRVNSSYSSLNNINVISNLTGLSGEIDFFVGYGKESGDVVYNKEPFHIKVTDNYDRVLTVGEHGQYSGCNNLQNALNVLQDWNEIRIEKGVYNCSGVILHLGRSKDFELGIKISGGWDSSFSTQNNDASLTVFDGELEDSGAASFQAFLNIYSGPITIESISFTRFHSFSISKDSKLPEKIFINQCSFTHNIDTPVKNVVAVTNSLFSNNTVGSRGRGAIENATLVANSTFDNNTTLGYAAISGTKIIVNSIFTNNSSRVTTVGASFILNSKFINNETTGSLGIGGAAAVSFPNSYISINNLFYLNVANSGAGAVKAGTASNSDGYIINNTFVENTGSSSAFTGHGTILNSIFSENNKIVNGIKIPSDIFAFNNLHIDYSLFNVLDNAADVGIHNITGDPLFVDITNNDLHLQGESPARNSGDNTTFSSDFITDYISQLGIADTSDTSSYLISFLTNKGATSSLIDLDKNNRLQGETIDMGAYEHP